MRGSLSKLIVLGIIAALVGSVSQAQAQEKPNSAETALVTYEKALKAGDFKAISDLTSGDSGKTLRKLADAFVKAQAASKRLDDELTGRPSLNLKNPFAGAFTTFNDAQFDLVELEKDKDGKRYFARVSIKLGPSGKAQEETLIVQTEGGEWRVDPPADLAKQLRAYSTEAQIENQIKGLTKLANILDTVAGEITIGKLATREAIVIRIVEESEKQKLGELLK